MRERLIGEQSSQNFSSSTGHRLSIILRNDPINPTKMHVREFISVAICGTISLALVIQSALATSQNLAIQGDEKVTVNLGDLVIEVTPPRGRESLLNAEPFYDQWQNVDDVAYWESIYGSMDNIPAFEDLPEIAGETFELKLGKEIDEQIFNAEDKKTLEKIMEKSSKNFNEKKKPEEAKSSTDRCEWVNPLYPQEKWSIRQKRETPLQKEAESNDAKRKPRTLSLLYDESGKSRRKSGIHSTRRSDYFFNKYGRKNYRSYKSEHQTSTLYDRRTNDDIIDCAPSVRFVDSAINAGELVNTRFEERASGQVVADTTANEGRQLGQTKHNVIDLGFGGRQAIGLGSLNNAAADCSGDGVNAAEANIDSGIEVVGNSVLDTNSGIINKDTRSVDEIEASLATETGADAIDTAGTLVDNDIDNAEIVGANLRENGDDEIAPDLVADSKLELVADEGIHEEIKATETVPEILDKDEIVGQTLEVPAEDCLKVGNNNDDQIEIVGAKLEEKSDTEIATEVKAEVPVVIEDNVTNSEATELVTNAEKSDADEIVGSSLKINSAGGIKASINAEISTDLKTNINVGKNKHHHGKAPRNFRREDLSCECFGSSEEEWEPNEDPRRYDDEYQEFEDQRYREGQRHHAIHRDHQRTHNSGIHADAGFRSSLDTGIDMNSNLGSKSLHAASASSLDVHSNLDIGTSRNSGIHATSGIHKSSGITVDVNSDRQAADLRAGATSSLDLDSHLDNDRARIRPHESRYRHYDDFESNEDFYDFYESEEKRDYERGFPEGNTYRKDHRDKEKIRHSGIHANSGIHASLNAGLDANADLRSVGTHSGLHANSGIQTSLNADIHLNSDVSGGHLRMGSGGTLNEAASRSTTRNGNYRSDDAKRFEDTSSEYDEYDEELEYGRRFPDVSHIDHSSRYRGRKSGIRGNSGFRTSLDTAIDINSDAGAAADGDLRVGSKTSLNQESHLDIGSSTLGVNGANSRHLTGAINSRVRADGGIHTYDDIGLDVNVGDDLHTGIKSSLDLDSHLDIATETKRPTAGNERSRISGNVNTANGKLGEKICETACRGISDSREDTAWPNSRFDDAYDGRSEYPQRELSRFAERGEAPYYMCDNCRIRLHGEAESSCPMCGRLDDRPPQERRHFLSSGTMYHFDGHKQNFKRTADYENACSYNHHINLDANCTDATTSGSPDCQGLDYDLQTPRDGNPVPLGFVRTHLSHGHDIAVDMHDRARSLVAGGLQPRPHTASMLNLFNNKVADDLVKLNEESELTLVGTKLLQQKLSVDYNITPNTFLEFLNNHGFRVTGDRICRGRHKRCGGYDKFRSHDGSCNNIDHPTWGQSNRAFARILPARYSDGIHGMPVSVTGAELPNPRKLSVRLYSRSGNLDPELTLAVVQWGQTLAHDLARQVMDQTTKGGIECCGNNGKSQLPKSLQHHSCAPISISPRDKFYSSHGQRCMNFVRAMTVTREDCTLGPADQLNGATSFLDCSSVYGGDKITSDELREFYGGRMKVEFRSGRWMLPTMRNRSNFCDIWTSDDVCYRTGDPRNNQNPQLVILQTLLVREHNRIANGLSALNPKWNDERIFQESRRIVIAEYQHITYNEWLPLLLGKRYCRRHGIIRTKPGMSNEYDERVNPSTIIGFTSGAFRSLHSMIDGNLGLCNVDGDIVDNLRLSDHYFRPRVIEENNNFEHLLRGLTMQRMQKQNMHLHRELTEYLFRSRNDYGMDLAAIDIQRGRDHGVPGYNAYRKICRLRPAQDFDDLSEEISWENIEKLRRDYAHVDDIDLIVGATMENRVSGSQFGPTNRCLIGEQFFRSRVGDRYFYDNEKLPHSFTTEQFDEITKITLSRLMCDMGGAVAVVQRYAFRSKSSRNPLVPCEDLPKLDLAHWIE